MRDDGEKEQAREGEGGGGVRASREVIGPWKIWRGARENGH
jgi:hypothetical protein